MNGAVQDHSILQSYDDASGTHQDLVREKFEAERELLKDGIIGVACEGDAVSVVGGCGR
jgi:hypothetical protein